MLLTTRVTYSVRAAFFGLRFQDKSLSDKPLQGENLTADGTINVQLVLVPCVVNHLKIKKLLFEFVVLWWQRVWFFTGLVLDYIYKALETPWSYSGGALADLPGLLLLRANSWRIQRGPLPNKSSSSHSKQKEQCCTGNDTRSCVGVRKM